MKKELHSLVDICCALDLEPNVDDSCSQCARIDKNKTIHVTLPSYSSLTAAFFDNLKLLAGRHTVKLYPTRNDILSPTSARELDSSSQRISKLAASFILYADGLIDESKQDKLDFKTAYKYLNYSPETGAVSWKVDINPTVPSGTSGGFKHSSGQHIIKIDGEVYRLNRVIWLLQTGSWPTGRIKHKDDNLNNLRWNNLYEEKSKK